MRAAFVKNWRYLVKNWKLLVHDDWYRGRNLRTSKVIYLLWAELFRVGAICLWCTAVHVCTLGLFVTILLHPAGRSTATGHYRFTSESSRR
jgi:uncharacterized membrane protein